LHAKRPASLWSDNAIVASLDTRLSGEVDRDNVTLVIEPASGSSMEKPGFKFFAARETVDLKSIPDLAIRLGAPNNSSISNAQSVPGMGVEVFRADSWDPSGNTPNFSTKPPFDPGTDVFDFSILAAGFNVANAQIEHFDKYPDPNDHRLSTSTGWNVLWEANGVRVKWGVSEFQACDPVNCQPSDEQQECVGCPSGTTTVTVPPTIYNIEASMYALNVWVSGPRGVSPWRTAMGAQPNPAVKPKGPILAPHQPNPANKPHP
jgi:hypothetical protein